MTILPSEDPVSESQQHSSAPSDNELLPGDAICITACILARNEEAQIEGAIQCLLGWVDQIIVLDNESNDRTGEIARAQNALVVPIPLAETGSCFDAARNRAIEHATGDWIFYLDADERVPPPLGPLLRQIVTQHGDQFEAVMIPFKHYFCGKWMQHCNWWPGYTRPQLLKKGCFHYNERLHAGVDVRGRTVMLPADNPDLAIDHHSFGSIHHYLEKLNRYTDGEAENLRADGYSHSWQAMLASFVRDWQIYYDRGEGHRDGMHGFVLSFLSAFYRFAALAKVWDLRRKQDELVNPTEPVPESVAEAIRFMRKVIQIGPEHWLRPQAVPTLRRVPAAWLTPKETPVEADTPREPSALPARVASSPSSAISACVVVRNEARIMQDALRSLAGWTRRIIFIDNDSEDNTVEVARRYTDDILSVRGVYGHLEVVRAAVAGDIERLAFSEANLSAASGNHWLLFLDADERIPPKLAETLTQLVAEHGQEFEALFLPFKWFFCGKWIQSSGKWPGYKAAPQMVKGGAYRFNPHVHWGGEITGRSLYFPADDPDLGVLHYSVHDIAQFLYKENRSTTQEVPLRDAGGWDYSWQAQMAHFVLEWQDAYDTCQASREGMHGFILAFLQGMSRYFIRAKVWDFRQQQGIALPEQLPHTITEILDFWETVMDEGADQWFSRLSLAPAKEDTPLNTLPTKRSGPLNSPGRWQLKTSHPVALTSVDHLHPHGTVRDNSREPTLARILKAVLQERDLPPIVMDIGCAGGGFVRDCLEVGLEAVGLEGCDLNQKTGRAEWSVIPDHLFTCDVRHPFQVGFLLPPPRGFVPVRCGVITAWEFLEHLAEEELPDFFTNLIMHLMPGGWFIGSISPHRYSYEGIDYHLTQQPLEWWETRFREIGLVRDEEMISRVHSHWVRQGDIVGCWQYRPGEKTDMLPNLGLDFA